jgi:hypothetical protein
MPSIFDIASELYGFSEGIARVVPKHIHLLDGSNLFFLDRETNEFVADPANWVEWKPPSRGDHVDCIVVMSDITYDIVSKYRAKAGRVLKQAGLDGRVFFLVPQVRACGPRDSDNCLVRDKTKSPVECQFMFPRSSSEKGHLFCEYDDVILYQLNQTLNDDSFKRFSIWDGQRQPDVRILTADKKLRRESSKNWRDVFAQLKKLGMSLSIDIIIPNPQAYNL